MKKYVPAISLFGLLLIIALSGPAAGADSEMCLSCHSTMTDPVTLPSGIETSIEVNTEKFKASVHGEFLQCSDCHKQIEEYPHVLSPKTIPGNLAPLVKKLSHKAKIDPVAASACSECHGDVFTEVLSSVHGQNIVEKKKSDGALCRDCHGSPHYIVKSDNPESHVNQFMVVETCGHCHGNEELMREYGIESDIMGTYKESFHGRKHHLGHTKAPTCVSCHGAHNVKADTDPASPVYGDNRIETCGKCHKGANSRFISGVSHKPAGPIPHYAEKGLILLTLGTFAFIVSHVLLDAFADARDAIFRRRRKDEHE